MRRYSSRSSRWQPRMGWQTGCVHGCAPPPGWRAIRIGVSLWVGPLLLTILALTAGCSRSFYRHQADADAYFLIQQKTGPRWPLERYRIDIDPRSRMFDTARCPDCPPLPPDDPAAHKLMHCVDCKKGYPCWHANGDTPYVQNPFWIQYLPLEEDGTLTITEREAVKLALLNSPDYQRELEDLYLSALDVSFERFRFETQFFAGYQANFEARNSSSELQVGTFPSTRGIRAQTLFPAGAELVVGFANSLVWQFSGPDTQTANTLIDFALLQPLLRRGGRDRVLERLTIAERALLANVRQMERYRRGFYMDVTTGRDAGPGPSRRGGVFGGAGLEGFTGIGGGGFGQVGGSIGGVTGGAAGAADAGGYLGLLQDQQNIRNQQANIASLRSSLAQLEAFFQAGRIDYFQVELARQALFNAQSVLLNAQASYQATLDRFKATLGLPPQLNIEIKDSLLDQFNLLDPEITPRQDQITQLQQESGTLINDMLAELARGSAPVVLRERIGQVRKQLENVEQAYRELIRANVPRARQDIATLRERVPDRVRDLRALKERGDENEGADLDPQIVSEERIEQLPDQLTEKLDTVMRLLREIPQQTGALKERLDKQLATSGQQSPQELSEQLRRDLLAIPSLLSEFSAHVLELALVQARARTESITLPPSEIDAVQALDIARQNRLDWMNARAGLVDAWRLIQFNADDLESTVDIVFSGDISNVGDNPFRLDGNAGRLRAGVQFDAPITRLAERNTYRQALIEYQQARRSYYEFQDSVARGLRSTVRIIRLNQLNFELRRAAVNVAVAQVELARLRLQEPPQPNEQQVFGATTARDLVNALSDLLSVQDTFLSVWVNFEVQRRSLDFDMGTMQLDCEGIWVDPDAVPGGQADGASGGSTSPPQPPADLAPEVAKRALPCPPRSEPAGPALNAAQGERPEPAPSFADPPSL